MIKSFEDFSEMQDVPDKIAYTSKFNSNRAVYQNLGIYKTRNGYHTGRYAGITWLRNEEGQVKVSTNNEEKVMLKIIPRFDLKIDDMIQKIAEDEEFFDYLCSDQPDGDKMFTFFLNEEMLEVEKDENGANLIMVVITFVHALYQETRRSLIKKIIRKEENFTGKVKGKIIFNKQISKNLAKGREERVYCGYVEKSEDIFENQVLKIALNKANDFLNSKGSKINNSQINREIKACQLRLSKVADLESVEPEDVEKIKLPAMYSNYEFLLKLAQILIASVSMTSKVKNESNKIIPYAVNMPLLFECYVRTLIKENIKDTGYRMLKFVPDKSASYNEEHGMKTIEGNYYISGKVVPDIVLVKEENGKKKIIVLDAKYKKMNWTEKDSFRLLEENPGRREDRLQLLAYNQLYQPEWCGHVVPRFTLNGCDVRNPLCFTRLSNDEKIYTMIRIRDGKITMKGLL